ncbi:MAG: hypothetical protein QOF70_195 [Acetobacteraceae bacterium]|jgi:hypothetical protein|nr:hypothetical protein [Acetobacteraceae bacterium]
MVRRGPASVYRRKSGSKSLPRIALTGPAPLRACRMMIRLFDQRVGRSWTIIPSSSRLSPSRDQILRNLQARGVNPAKSRPKGARQMSRPGTKSIRLQEAQTSFRYHSGSASNDHRSAKSAPRAQDALSPVLARTAPLLARLCPPGRGMLREARRGSDQYGLAPSAAQLTDWRLPIASNPGRY